ncbi:MAG: ketoacyl-ACP synthase III [Spirochaetaceae bacterium]|jgi:3-oxoacyl-[acyl-carrier-protein] synthase-3|nr:ketoacyl-ACP synthase III [Spirochaetaceae bacterium]
MAFEILATGSAVPANKVTNDDLSRKRNIDTSDEWIRGHTGIGARHIADENTATSDLAIGAARNAIASVSKKTGESAEDITASLDLIITSTVTPDYNGFPSVSCIVQDALGAKNAAAMDVGAACSGFIYGLETAAGLLSLNADRKRALIIGAETLSRITDWDDRATCVLFGDGAGGVILEKTDAPASGDGARGLLRTILGAEGSGKEALINRRGGSRSPYKKGAVIDQPPCLEMDGRAVYNFAVRKITETIEKLLAAENMTLHDIAVIVPHQANARIVQAAAKRLAVSESKFFLNIEEYANTSAASIPIALDELNRSGRLAKGDAVLMVGFGGGLTYGGNIVIW